MQGISLNEHGRVQAQELAQQLSALPLDAVYSSPLERAVETASPIAAMHGLQVVPCDDFLEINFGDWTDKTFDELAALPQFQRFNFLRSNTRIPGGESMPEAQIRMVTGMEKLRAQHPGGVVAIVSHADMIKATLAYYAGIHLDLFQRLEISPASVSAVRIGEDFVQVLFINHVGGIKI